MVARGIAILAIWMLCEALATAQCGGVQRSTPVRNLIASRPVLTTLQKIQANTTARRDARSSVGCSGSQTAQASCSCAQAAGCSGSKVVSQAQAPMPQSVGCSGSMIVPQAQAPMPPAVKFISVPVQDWIPIPIKEAPIQFEIFQPPKRAPVCVDGRCDFVKATPVRDAVLSAYQQALESAEYRAANRIKGHSYLDTHRTSGVGWATSDPTPTTCLGRGGDAYAVARGVDGWYATKFSN
jgi:hypothetical protein